MPSSNSTLVPPLDPSFSSSNIYQPLLSHSPSPLPPLPLPLTPPSSPSPPHLSANNLDGEEKEESDLFTEELPQRHLVQGWLGGALPGGGVRGAGQEGLAELVEELLDQQTADRVRVTGGGGRGEGVEMEEEGRVGYREKG